LEILGVARTYLFTLGDKNQFPLVIDASRPLVWSLQAEVDACARFLTAGGGSVADFAQHKAQIQEQAARLNVLLDGDLGHQPVFHVFPKRAYDVSILTSDATQIFSPVVRDALSEEETFNLKEAG